MFHLQQFGGGQRKRKYNRIKLDKESIICMMSLLNHLKKMEMKEYNDISDFRFSFFESNSEIESKKITIPSRSLSFDEFINYSLYDEKLMKNLEIIRTNKDKQVVNRIKGNLPFITPYGEFNYRNNKSISSYNRLIAVDIDNLENEKTARKVKEKIINLESVFYCSLSPRLKGVKALLSVESNYDCQDQFKQLKYCFTDWFAENIGVDSNHIDKQQFVLCQPLFFTNDNEVYYSKSVKPLSEVNFDYEAPKFTPYECEYDLSKISDFNKYRVNKYILKALDNLILSLNPNTARHYQIKKITGISCLLHYSPSISNKVKTEWTNAIFDLYGSDDNGKNILNSVNNAFHAGLDKPKYYYRIDNILKNG